MIYNAMKILADELNKHFNEIKNNVAEDDVVVGNIGLIGSEDGVNLKDKIVLTLVGILEEKTLKNTAHYKTVGFETHYQNPPINLNLYLLFSVTTNDYDKALIYLSRIIRFFQSKTYFTHTDSPNPYTENEYDKLSEYKLRLDLYSPSFEEIYDMWGTLGGKQYPSVMYVMRMIELKRDDVLKTEKVIEQIESRFVNKS